MFSTHRGPVRADRSTHLLRESMISLETKLAPAQFAIIYRSKFINLNRVLELVSVDNGESL